MKPNIKNIIFLFFLLNYLSFSYSSFIPKIPLIEESVPEYINLSAKKNTYYVSSSGKSDKGLSENDPMNYQTLKNKEFNSGDKILFKCGDSFYGNLNLKITKVDNAVSTISSYGDKDLGLPRISAYKIVKKNESWEKYNISSVYKLDLSNFNKFDGLKVSDTYTNGIGFLEDKNKKKYYSLKRTINELKNAYDFYCDGTYIYIKTKGDTPYKELGELKLASRVNLVIPKSNMKIENLHVQGTGAHGINTNSIDLDNVEICNNIFEDIGGSYLNSEDRYGNGIQFYEINIKNLYIHHNIIRNIYDVGFTIQGNKGSGLNILVKTNIFCLNSQDSEIWQTSKATGVYNYTFEDNISYMQGRGWGYDARPDKYAAGEILFWGYKFDNLVQKTKIYFTKNYVYNPRKLYFIANQQNTSEMYKKENCIRSDYNNFYMNNDTIIYQNEYNYSSRETYIKVCNKDHHSKFILLDSVDKDIAYKANNSNNFDELRGYFFKEEKSGSGWVVFIVILIIILLCLAGGIYYLKRKHITFKVGGLLLP